MAPTSKFHPVPLITPHIPLNSLDFSRSTPPSRSLPLAPTGAAQAHASAIIDRLIQ